MLCDQNAGIVSASIPAFFIPAKNKKGRPKPPRPFGLVVRGAPSGATDAGRVRVSEGGVLLRCATGDVFAGQAEDGASLRRHSPNFLTAARTVSDESEHRLPPKTPYPNGSIPQGIYAEYLFSVKP